MLPKALPSLHSSLPIGRGAGLRASGRALYTCMVCVLASAQRQLQLLDPSRILSGEHGLRWRQRRRQRRRRPRPGAPLLRLPRGLRTGLGALRRAWRLRAGLRRVRGRDPRSVRLGFVSASGGTRGFASAAIPRGPARGSRAPCGCGPAPLLPGSPRLPRRGLHGPGRWLLPGPPRPGWSPRAAEWALHGPTHGTGSGSPRVETPTPSPPSLAVRLLGQTHRGDCVDPQTRESVTLGGGSFLAPHDGFLSVLSLI
ncbi:uncharacterized protein LOC117085849 [Trachypithecus francoisi]|uniref:uncharacterized protein LOC117085849 n=1 Tax=Trachypithecus francoisi TaxID=54180 RepID=UPI00141B06C3|nr:uncharacterized protein LOC117085849 [Trachypithecus francoisi]